MKANRQSDSQTISALFAGGQQISLRQAADLFYRAEAGKWSPQTGRWYRDRLEPLLEYLGGDRALSDLQEADLLGWEINLRERDERYGTGSSHPALAGGLSPYTLHGFVRACRRFFKWLCGRGILPVNLAAPLQLPKLPRQGRKGVSEAAAAAILEAAKASRRDYALIRFIADTGVRRGGAENLKLSDLNLDSAARSAARSAEERLRRRATVREKGEKERTVILSLEALSALEAWLKERPAVADDHVFLGASPGQAWHALTDVGISQVFARYKRALGIQGPCSPHQWRHRWCRRNLERGMPIGHVSQLAGHADIKVTHDFYGQFSVDQLQDSYDKYFRE